MNQLEVIKKYPVSQEQEDFFYKRTNAHIERVKKNAEKLVEKFLKFRNDLLLDVSHHDLSKFSPEEFYPYIWMTSVLNLGYEYPSEEVESLVDKAWKHHYLNNSHHPEYWTANGRSIRQMDEVNLAHMVCDWAAMSQEFKTSLNDWYNAEPLKKFKFTTNQKECIEKFMEVFNDFS